MTAMTPKIHTYKKEMDFERKSHLTVAVKMFRCKLNLHMVRIICNYNLCVRVKVGFCLWYSTPEFCMWTCL